MIDEAWLAALPEDGNLQHVWEQQVTANNDRQEIQQPEMGSCLLGHC